MTAAERLAQAAESVQAHASQLSERGAAARARALELQMAGKKADALMALKRAKALEKQAATALSTHAALESQQDMLESSALQTRDRERALGLGGHHEDQVQGLALQDGGGGGRRGPSSRTPSRR